MTSLESQISDDEEIVAPPSKTKETVLMFLAFFGMILFVALVGNYFHRQMFRGYGPEALDVAQLARNISGGRGFTTDFVRPTLLSGDHKWTGNLVPDFSNSPLQPLLIAFVFAMREAQDSGIGIVSMGCFLLSSGLLFCLTRRLSGKTSTAILTVMAFALSLPVLLAVDGGHRVMVSMALLLALLLVLTPAREMDSGAALAADAESETLEGEIAVPKKTKPMPKGTGFDGMVTPEDWAAHVEATKDDVADDDDELLEEATPPSKWTGRAVFAGFLIGLCYLADSMSLLYIVPLVICWMRGRAGWNGAAARWMVLAFVVMCLPWLVRNFRLSGNPFASTQWLSLEVGTPDYPGFSVYRDTTPFALSDIQLADFLRKIARGWLTLLSSAPSVPNLYLAPFVLGAFWLRFSSPLMPRLKKGLVFGLAIAAFGLSFFGSTSAVYLTPLAPLLALLGVLGFQTLVEMWIASSAEARRARMPVAQDFVSLMEQTPVGVNQHWDPQRFGPIAATLGLFVLFLLPLAKQLLSPPPPTVEQKALIKPLAEVVNAKGAIVTDVPWAVAWYAKRQAIWIPATVAQLDPLSKKLPVSAVYLSSSVPSIDANDPEAIGNNTQIGQWTRLYQTQGNLPEYDKLVRQEARDLVWVKRPTLDETRRLAKSKPRDVAAQQALGDAALERNQFKEALTAYLQVQRLRPRLVTGYYGAGRALLALRQENSALAQFEKVIALPVTMPGVRVEAALRAAQIWQGRGNDARASQFYQTVLADAPGHPIALNNLAYIYSTGKSDLPRALEMARRAAVADPTNSQILDTLGWVCSRMGRYDEAVLYLRAAIQKMPRSAIANFHLGMTLRASGKADAAVQFLRRGLDIGLPPAESKQATAILENAAP